jgi:hypothetical protein
MSQQPILLARHSDPQPGFATAPAEQLAQAERSLQTVHGPEVVARGRSGRPHATGDLFRTGRADHPARRGQTLHPAEGEQPQTEADNRQAPPGLGEGRPVREAAGASRPTEEGGTKHGPIMPKQPALNCPQLQLHRLFGFTLGSDFPFASCLGQGGPPPADLVFLFEAAAEAAFGDCVYQSRSRTAEGASTFSLHRSPDHEVLSFPQAADFHLWPDRIVARPRTPEPSPLVEIHLLGPVFSYWLERRGLVTLHASAVTVGQQIAAFVSTHGGGKTGLAASLVQAGHPLLSDDLLPLEERDGLFLGRPGYPQMRMWPDEAAHFLGRSEDLPLVHPDLTKRRVAIGSGGPGGFGTFHGEAAPLSCLYLLDRQPDGDAPIEIREVSPRDALIELLRHSFTPLLVEAAGLQPARFDLLSRLVLQVPVKRLSYPSGFDRLPRVAEAVRRDLERC